MSNRLIVHSKKRCGHNHDACDMYGEDQTFLATHLSCKELTVNLGSSVQVKDIKWPLPG